VLRVFIIDARKRRAVIFALVLWLRLSVSHQTSENQYFIEIKLANVFDVRAYFTIKIHFLFFDVS
jgi:hypothetical protein